MMDIKEMLNTVVQGDSLTIMKEMPDECVDIVVTSPPYNLLNSKGSGFKASASSWINAALRDGYDGHSDDMPYEEYIKWQQECVKEMFRLIKPDGAVFYNNKNRIQGGLLEDRSVIVRDLPLRQVITWERAGGMNFNDGYFVPTTEQIYMICKPKFKLVKQANRFGDVWKITQEMNNPHPSPFPVELSDRIVQSAYAQIILDPFGGSGTTAVSALKAKRNYILIEKSQKYCEMARKRIENKDWRDEEPPYACELF